MQQYGKIISKLRKEHNMTQAELGAKLNITYQAISKWENDQSQPDFATMVEIAKLFNVPLTIFLGENSENIINEDINTQNSAQILGYCKNCGVVVKEDNIGQSQPIVLCKACKAASEEEKIRQQKKEEQEKNEQKLLQQEEFERKEEEKIKSIHKGLIWALVVSVIVLIVGIIIGATTENILLNILYAILFAVVIFTFIAQLFWDGFIVDVVCFGGKIIGTPGIIFTFDLDGFIFLIVMKLLFAVIKFLVYILTFIATACFAIICSPFTFFFAMHRVKTEGLI